MRATKRNAETVLLTCLTWSCRIMLLHWLSNLYFCYPQASGEIFLDGSKTLERNSGMEAWKLALQSLYAYKVLAMPQWLC